MADLSFLGIISNLGKISKKKIFEKNTQENNFTGKYDKK